MDGEPRIAVYRLGTETENLRGGERWQPIQSANERHHRVAGVDSDFSNRRSPPLRGMAWFAALWRGSIPSQVDAPTILFHQDSSRTYAGR